MTSEKGNEKRDQTSHITMNATGYERVKGKISKTNHESAKLMRNLKLGSNSSDFIYIL